MNVGDLATSEVSAWPMVMARVIGTVRVADFVISHESEDNRGYFGQMRAIRILAKMLHYPYNAYNTRPPKTKVYGPNQPQPVLTIQFPSNLIAINILNPLFPPSIILNPIPSCIQNHILRLRSAILWPLRKLALL